MNKKLKMFLSTRRALANVQGATLKLMPHIYTKKMAEKVSARPDWVVRTIADAREVLFVQYGLAKSGSGARRVKA